MSNKNNSIHSRDDSLIKHKEPLNEPSRLYESVMSPAFDQPAEQDTLRKVPESMR